MFFKVQVLHVFFLGILQPDMLNYINSQHYKKRILNSLGPISIQLKEN